MSHTESRDRWSSLVALLHWRATHQAEQPAYTFLLDGETEELRLSYRELDQQAQAIAARLQRLDAPGSRALLLYSPGLDYIAAFFGCLYAQVTAVPVYPPRLNRPTPRLEAIVRDSQATVVLTTATMLANTEQLFVQAPYLKGLHWLATDDLTASDTCWQPPQVEPSQQAFLQYTSGSTSVPKGVILTHANLLANLELIQNLFEHTSESRGMIWLPPYHDMGLIGGILQPLYAGFPVTLMSPMSFLQRPLRWLQAISRYGATTSGGPNFAYDLCVQKITAEQRQALDLSTWSVAFNGAEPIRAETLDRFAAAFAECGFRREAFYPCYGLAEATLIVAGGKKAEPPIVHQIDGEALEYHRIIPASSDNNRARTLVSSGRTPANQRIVIAEPETGAECRPDQIGEIWVAGPSIAQGYWNHPAASEQTFAAYLAASRHGPFLRTGDLGFLHGGELFVTGRIKDLIILRGRNYYPQDIEATVERCHPGLQQGACAAFVVESSGEDRLVVVQEIQRHQRNIALDQVTAAIRQAVIQEHELHVHTVALIKEGTIPRTSSGKIQRFACRTEYLTNKLSLIAGQSLEPLPATATTVQVEARPIRDLLAMTEDRAARKAVLINEIQGWISHTLQSQAGAPEELLSRLGLDSLMIVELKNTIEERLGVNVPVAQLLDDITLTDLADELLDQIKAPATATVELVAAAEALAEYPLSHGQRSLWLLHQLAPESAAYNIASAFRVVGDLDIPTLQQALQMLIDRHPALRTTYHAEQSTPIQRIHARSRVDVTIEDASNWSEPLLQQRLAEIAYRPFDLQHGPLLRTNLFIRGLHEHVLLLAVHHIAVDLWSLVILIDELRTLYPALRAGEPSGLPPLEIQYTDYVRWQERILASSQGEQLWNYWQQQLQPQHGSELPVLELPIDRPRPPVQTYRGAAHAFELNATITAQLKELAQASGATLFMTLLAAYQALLALYTGQREILVGSPTSGRDHPRLAPVIGYFVNPVVLRADLSDNPAFSELLTRTRRTVLAALDHQAYPFPLLVQRLRPTRDSSYSPLFQAALVLEKPQRLAEQGIGSFVHGEIGAQMDLGELVLESLPLVEETTQFDLTLSVVETHPSLSAAFKYNRDLFEPATIARMAEHFQVLLARIVANPHQSLVDLALPPSAELRRMLHDWNATAQPYARGCIHELFAIQSTLNPQAWAVRSDTDALTYVQLEARANQVAHALQALGVGRDPQREDRIAICMERSTDFVVGLLAILKAGAAYIPLDPSYPAERLRFMLDDSGAMALLTQARIQSSLPQHHVTVLCLDTDSSIATYPTTPPRSHTTPGHLAYIIYTSGSTGQPKGVQIDHQSVLNLTSWHQRTFAISPADRATQLAGPAFDASVWEIWPYLLAGATIVIPDDETRTLPIRLQSWLCDQSITISFVPTPIAEQLIALPWPDHGSLRFLLTGGDRLQRYPSVPLPFTLINNYGPTECSVVATSGVVPDRAAATTAAPLIGRPIDNTAVFILGPDMQPLPVGVAGEMYIASAGLARGYLNRPGLTAERFVPNPFATDTSDPLGSRLYRTGDRVRYQMDGTIEFLGRIDQQVKLRGFRIELGEIEAALRQHPMVREVIVLMRNDASSDPQLVAYVIENQDRGSSIAGDVPAMPAVLDSSVLRAFLRQRLPEHMVPSAFVSLNAFPLTPNGKIDRRALPVPDRNQDQMAERVAPRTPTEATLAAIWSELLGIEQIGVHDNFFDRGGHSLLGAQVVSRVRKAFGVELPLSSFFEQPSIADLAATIDRHQDQPTESTPAKIQSVPRRNRAIGRIAAHVDQLSESEVKQLLEKKRLAKKRDSHE